VRGAFLKIKKVVNEEGWAAQIRGGMSEPTPAPAFPGAYPIGRARFFDTTNLFHQENWCIQEKHS